MTTVTVHRTGLALLDSAGTIAATQFARPQLPTFAPPYPDVRTWMRSNWMRRHGVITPAQALANVQKLATDAQTDLSVAVAQIQLDTRFGAEALRALQTGLMFCAAGAAIGAAIGSVFPVVGTAIGGVIGGAAGFIIGCVCGILPIEQWNTMTVWGSVVDSLTPVERYFLVPTFRQIVDQARATDGVPKLARWQLSRNFETIYTGQGVALACLHKVCNTDWIPQPIGDVTTTFVDLPLLAKYACGVACCELPDTAIVFGGDPTIEPGCSEWVHELLTARSQSKAGDIRDKLINGTPAMTDIDQAPVTQEITDALVAAQALIASRQAAAAGTT